MEVKFYSSALKYTGGKGSLAIEPDNCPDLYSLIEELGSHFGEEFKKLLTNGETWLLLINGKAVKKTGGIKTPLKQDDTIEVLPLVGAG